MPDFPAALPHGPLLRVADGVHCVRGRFRMGPGVVISRTMTVLEGEDGLVVLNAVRLGDEGEAALGALGPVAHLVRLSDSHGRDEPYYLDRYAPTFWTLPGAKLGRLPAGRALGPDGPVPGGVVIDLGPLPGWREAAYLVPHGGGTLVAVDALQNHCDAKGTSALGRLVTPLLGFRGGVIVAPMWRKAQKLKGAAVAEALAPLVARPFANLLTGHGPAVVGGADALVREAIAKASA